MPGTGSIRHRQYWSRQPQSALPGIVIFPALTVHQYYPASTLPALTLHGIDRTGTGITRHRHNPALTALAPALPGTGSRYHTGITRGPTYTGSVLLPFDLVHDLTCPVCSAEKDWLNRTIFRGRLVSVSILAQKNLGSKAVQVNSRNNYNLDYHEHSYAIYGCKISDELRFVRRVLIIQTREHDGKISCIRSVNDKINNSHVQRKLRESINSSLKSVINFIHLFIYELQTSGTEHHDALL